MLLSFNFKLFYAFEFYSPHHFVTIVELGIALSERKARSSDTNIFDKPQVSDLAGHQRLVEQFRRLLFIRLDAPNVMRLFLEQVLHQSRH